MAEDLAAGRAVAVSAGHQVGLFTGPAFTLMKALDAIRIAGELSRRGVPAVPVFWALTDDHDLQEIARTARPTHDGPQELVLEGADRQNRQPVGRLPIPERVREIVDAFREDPAHTHADADRILEEFAARSAPGVTYGDAFIETLLDLVDPDPLLVIEPLAPEVRPATVEFFLDGRREGGRALGHASRHRGPSRARRQAGPGAAAGGVLVLPDRRRGPPARDGSGRRRSSA